MEHWDRTPGVNPGAETFPTLTWQNLQQHNVLQLIVKSLECSFRCKVEGDDMISPKNKQKD